MEAKDRQVLEKINRHISAVLDYCRDCTSLEEFESNSMRVEACVFNLMQIGDDAKADITAIPWKQLYGMRNRIVHGYSGVDMRIVWDTISDDLEPLKAEIEKYLP